MDPHPSLQSEVGKEKLPGTVWRGLVEWSDKTHNTNDKTHNTQKVIRSVAMQMTVPLKNGETNLKADLWPKTFRMTLIPKHLVDQIWDPHFKNSINIPLYPQPCRDFEFFTKSMKSGCDKMTTQELEALGAAVLQFLECPVCHIIPQRSYVIQCVVGHVMCSNCSQKLKCCPLCRGKFVLTPPRVFNKILEALPLCRHVGCSKLVSKGDQHESFCEFRLWECQWCCKATKACSSGKQNLNHSFFGHQLLAHTRQHHSEQLIADNETADLMLDMFKHDPMKNDDLLRKNVTKFIDKNLYQVEYTFNDISTLGVSCNLVGIGAEPINKIFFGTLEISTAEGTFMSFSRVFQGNSLTIALDKTTLNEFVGKKKLVFKTIFETQDEFKIDLPVKSEQSPSQGGFKSDNLENEKMGITDLKTLVTSLLRLARCFNCDTVPRVDSVVQCVKGHVFCSGCRSALLSCTICDSEFISKTPLVFSQLLDILPKFCVHKDCYQLIRPGDYHDFWCGFRPVECLWCVSRPSVFKGYEMLGHLQAQHSTELVTDDTSVDFFVHDLKEIVEVDKKIAKHTLNDLFFLEYSYFEECLHADLVFIPDGVPVSKPIYGVIEVSDEHGNCYSLCKEFSLNLQDINLSPLRVLLSVNKSILKQVNTSKLTFKTSIVDEGIKPKRRSILPVQSNLTNHEDSKRIKLFS